jgi:hypothetical protein
MGHGPIDGPKPWSEAARNLARKGGLGRLMGEAHQLPYDLALLVVDAPVASLLVDLQCERRQGVPDLIRDPVRVAPGLRREHRPGASQRMGRNLRQRRESEFGSSLICEVDAPREHAIAEPIRISAPAESRARGAEKRGSWMPSAVYRAQPASS